MLLAGVGVETGKWLKPSQTVNLIFFSSCLVLFLQEAPPDKRPSGSWNLGMGGGETPLVFEYL